MILPLLKLDVGYCVGAYGLVPYCRDLGVPMKQVRAASSESSLVPFLVHMRVSANIRFRNKSCSLVDVRPSVLLTSFAFHLTIASCDVTIFSLFTICSIFIDSDSLLSTDSFKLPF